MSALPHYEALVAEAMRVGWPLRFKTDRTEHDREFLEKRDPSLPFAWMLSEGATYLVGAEWTDRWLRRAYHFVGWVEDLGYETHYYFWKRVEPRRALGRSAARPTEGARLGASGRLIASRPWDAPPPGGAP